MIIHYYTFNAQNKSVDIRAFTYKYTKFQKINLNWAVKLHVNKSTEYTRLKKQFSHKFHIIFPVAQMISQGIIKLIYKDHLDTFFMILNKSWETLEQSESRIHLSSVITQCNWFWNINSIKGNKNILGTIQKMIVYSLISHNI